MKVLYTCSLCMLTDVPVEVTERLDGQDVVQWIEGVVTVALAADHLRRSPHCKPKTLTEVKIPLGDNLPVGQLPKN